MKLFLTIILITLIVLFCIAVSIVASESDEIIEKEKEKPEDDIQHK